ncbi:MAG: M10 family metallopeptidase C-terminal domain-containing protein, partial [Xanthobacteraceae bacterium]
NESRVGAASRDIITDFQRGKDRIDLKTIDAVKGLSGDQKFTFIGKQGFHHKAGELHYKVSGGHAIVSGDINGDAKADFEIELLGITALAKGDFLL